MGNDALDFLMGAGVPSASFPTIGSRCFGRIVAYEKRQQRDLDGNKKTWDDGEPMWQLVFTLDTGEIDPEIEGDDGMRKVYAKAQMLNAIREAVKKTGHQGDLVGGELGVIYSADGEQQRRGYNAPKVYVAKFEPPAQTADLGEIEPEQPYVDQGDLTEYGEEPF